MSRKFRMTFTVQFDRDDDGPDPINDPAGYIRDRADSLAEHLNDALESHDFYVVFDRLEEET